MRTQRHRFSRTLLETLESRTLLSTVPLGDPADTDPSSIPVPPIQITQTPDHALTLTGTPEITSQSAHSLDINLGTMTDSLAGTSPSDYRVWAMLTNSDPSFAPFATGAAATNSAGGFDLAVHFHFAAGTPSPTGVVTVHFGVYWAALLGQSTWPAELALGGQADLTLADQTQPPATTPVTDPSAPSVPAIPPATPLIHTIRTATHTPAGLLIESPSIFNSDFTAWNSASTANINAVTSLQNFQAAPPDSSQSALPTITIDGLDNSLTKKFTIKRVSVPTLH